MQDRHPEKSSPKPTDATSKPDGGRRRLAVGRGVTLLVWVTCATALAVGCGAFIVQDIARYRAETSRKLAAFASVTSSSVVPSLVANDTRAALELLSSLRAEPDIAAALIRDASGNLFARYERAENQDHSARPLRLDAGETISDGTVEVLCSITDRGQIIGTISLVSDFAELPALIRRDLLIVVPVLALLALAMVLVAVYVERRILKPIRELASVARTVVPANGQTCDVHGDAIAQLVGAMNDLLGQIQAKDADLKDARLEHERAQKAAALEKTRFKFIFESAPVGISCLVPGQDGTHLVNQEHVRITGVSAEDSLLPGAFARVSHPDDLRLQKEWTQKFVAGEIDHYSIEKRYLRSDGRVVWAVLTSSMFVDPTTGTKISVTTLVDITDLKRAQETTNRERARFKFILDSLPVGVAWMVRGQPDTRLVNPAHARISGVPAEQCQNLELYRRATHPVDQCQQELLHQQLTTGEIDEYTLEKRYLRADRSLCWAVLTVRHFFDAAAGESQEISTLVDITDRKHSEAELEKMHRQLLETSRQAGMAEVATGVLHNVGNVLNSVNISASLVADKVKASQSANLEKLCGLLRQHEGDLAHFIAEDPKGRQVPRYLQSLTEIIASERKTILVETDELRKNIEHIKEIVAMQQGYARISGVAETVALTELVEDALRMNAGALTRHEVHVVRDYRSSPVISVEKHKVMQILVNLIRNAKHACNDSKSAEKILTIQVTCDAERVRVCVIDNGVGIPPENITRIFAHGFTTRKNGHGFGLHSGALAARELGGSLLATSDGAGMGATFTLDLPFQPPVVQGNAA